VTIAGFDFLSTTLCFSAALVLATLAGLLSFIKFDLSDFSFSCFVADLSAVGVILLVGVLIFPSIDLPFKV